MNVKFVFFLKIIALAECIFGFLLLINELVSLLHLSSLQDINNQFGGTVDFFKYKESCYQYIFLYSLLLITGISFWINRKLYWGLTQVLLITIFSIINLWFMSIIRLGVDVCLVILTLIVFIYIEIKMCNSSFLQTMKITKVVKWSFFISGGLSFIIWLLLGGGGMRE